MWPGTAGARAMPASERPAHEPPTLRRVDRPRLLVYAHTSSCRSEISRGRRSARPIWPSGDQGVPWGCQRDRGYDLPVSSDPLKSALEEIAPKLDPEVLPLIATLLAGESLEESWEILLKKV